MKQKKSRTIAIEKPVRKMMTVYNTRRSDRAIQKFEHSTLTLLIIAVIIFGALSQSMGPLAHSAVPTGVLASQIPSWTRAG